MILKEYYVVMHTQHVTDTHTHSHIDPLVAWRVRCETETHISITNLSIW